MKRQILSLAMLPLLALGLVQETNAQNSEKRIGIELNAGFKEYQGDLGSALFFSKKPIYNGVGGSISHYYSPSIDLLLFGSSGDVGYQTTLPFVDAPFNEAGFKTRLFNVSVGVRYKFNNGVILPEESKLAPYLLMGWGGQYMHSRINNQERNYTGGAGVATGGLGLQYNLNNTISLRIQSLANYTFNDIWDGAPLTNGVHSRNKLNDMYMYHSVGIVYNIEKSLFGGVSSGPKVPKDSDKDGVPDKLDKCKNTPEGWIVDSVGCPLDSDGDGVYDHADSCRFTKGLVEFNGCPDSDGDGVPDTKDRCPNTAGAKEFNGCPDTDGDGVPDIDDRCPNEAGKIEFKGCPDSDGDGVPDVDDKCPSKPGPVEHQGCPDSDGDGVYDNIDKCPDVVGIVANKGCPEIKKEDVAKIALAAKGIYFETGMDVIKPESFTNLDILVGILKEYQEATVYIEGHTDNVGDPANNLELSQKRADAVMAYLINKGIQPSRLVANGYGDTKPIADNKTKDGKAKNRRVYFQLNY
jgi:OmpA-OmpF porin, OOP family